MTSAPSHLNSTIRLCFILGAWCLGTAIASGAEPTADIGADDLALVRAAEAARVRAIDSVYGSVVAIYGNDRQGGGSGVLYDPAGYALTNHHVVGAAGDGGWAGLADGKLYRWKLIGTDPGGDVAIIRLLGQEKFPVAPLGDSETVRVGDWAMAMGNPFVLAEDQRPTVTLGIVSGVKRFQEGSGLNQLVYGNCIQVDSSINPGNSGGPLFNLRGQVIGINGRGSFEERGRVNVGLGYAISSNQIKHFIPELLATKIAQHGTLDAVFGGRSAGVICHTLNLDAPIAKAGMQLGDKLVAFEGFSIREANEFTNLISMYPAGWPVEVTYEHEGVQQTARVRLTALPYEPRVKPMEKKPAEEKPAEGDKKPAAEEKKGVPRPEGDKPAEKPDAEKPDAEKPDQEKRDRPTPKDLKIEEQKIDLSDPGKVRDAKVNAEIAEMLLQRWVGSLSRNSEGDALVLKSEIRKGDQAVGEQVLTIAKSGKLRAEHTLDGKTTVTAFDGTAHWQSAPGRAAQEVSAAKAIRDPHFAQAAVMSLWIANQPLSRFGQMQLDGSDKAADRLSYRLSATDPSSEQLFMWLSVFDLAGVPRIELLKSGVGIDDSEPIPSTRYIETETRDGNVVPVRVTHVRGLAENVELEMVLTQLRTVSELPGEPFSRPQ